MNAHRTARLTASAGGRGARRPRRHHHRESSTTSPASARSPTPSSAGSSCTASSPAAGWASSSPSSTRPGWPPTGSRSTTWPATASSSSSTPTSPGAVGAQDARDHAGARRRARATRSGRTCSAISACSAGASASTKAGVFPATWQRVDERLGGDHPRARLRSTSGTARMVKSPEEVAAARAGRAHRRGRDRRRARHAAGRASPSARPRTSTSRRCCARAPSRSSPWSPSASGRRWPTSIRPIGRSGPGDLVRFDLGCLCQGRIAPTSRAPRCSGKPSDKQARYYAADPGRRARGHRRHEARRAGERRSSRSPCGSRARRGAPLPAAPRRSRHRARTLRPAHHQRQRPTPRWRPAWSSAWRRPTTSTAGAGCRWRTPSRSPRAASRTLTRSSQDLADPRLRRAAMRLVLTIATLLLWRSAARAPRPRPSASASPRR